MARLALGGLIVAFLVVFELLVVCLYYCANAGWSAKKPAAADIVGMDRVPRPMASRDGNSNYSKMAIVPPDEDNDSEV